MAEFPATSEPDPEPGSAPLSGVLWMLLAGLLFVAMTATVKASSADLPAPMSAFLRYVFGLVFLIPILNSLWRLKLTKRQAKHFALRGVVHTVGVCCWFYAMTRITIAEVTAMNYMVPIYVTLAAALFLGERLATRRIAAIAVAFVGALIILRPGLRELSDGHLAMIFTAFCLAASYVIAKPMADELPAGLVVGMLSITVTIGLTPLAIAYWHWPTGEETLWLLAVATLATGGHYSITRAFAAAPVSVTQPVVFMQLVWSVLLGYFLFDEGIDLWVIGGGILILAAASFITIREAMLRRRR
ncbi:MAG: DMT family transporter [Silicimonas sp.]|nr:DMT family transporter [Silicimonas sp.]